jgi:hypothetical protein
MAINPGARYPTQTTLPSPSFPYAGPKDIVSPGDNTGTPWIKEVIEDIWGLQQALLVNAGITPTDVPETADVSQYFDALATLFGQSVDATTDILTRSLASAPGLTTLGYAAAGDGGQSAWVSTGVTTPGKAGTTEFDLGFVYDADGRQLQIADVTLNPRQYGALGDGATNDQAAIQAAISTQIGRGGGVVEIDAGVYLCDSALNLGDKIVLRGIGGEITFAGATGSFPLASCIHATGSDTAVPALSSDVVPGQRLLSFSASHGLVAGDVFSVVDIRSSSYSSDESAYRAGEYFEVAEVVSSSTLDVTSPAYATTNTAVTGGPTDYAFGNCSVRKQVPVRVSIRNLKITGVSPISTRRVILVDFGRDCDFTDLQISDSNSELLSMAHAYNARVTDVTLRNEAISGTFNAGVYLGHCQRVYLTRVTGGGSFSMLATGHGGVDSDNTIVNREIFVSGCFGTQHGSSQGAIRCRSNTEYLSVTGSTIAGVLLGGDHHRIADSTIEGQQYNALGTFGGGWALTLADMTGGDVSVANCKITPQINISAGRALIQWDDTTSRISRPGTFRMSDCEIVMGAYTGDVWDFQSRATSVFTSVAVSGTRIQSDTSSTCEFPTASTAGWDRVSFKSCRFDGVDLSVGGALSLDIEGCISAGSFENGINIVNPASSPHASRSIRISNCNVYGADLAGIRILDQACVVQCVSVTSLNNNVNPSKASDRSSFVFDPSSGAGVTAVTLVGCVFGDDQAVATQTFAYHYDNVDDVVDSRTTILGGLPVTRVASILDTQCNVWDEDAEIQRSTGAAGFSGGDPTAAPTGAQDLALGNGSDTGIWMKSGTTGKSRIIAGDTGDDDKFILLFDHNNDIFGVSVGGSFSAIFSAGGINPQTTDTRSIGSNLLRWGAFYGGEVHSGRLFLDRTSFLLPGSLALNVNWGAGASVGVGLGSRDSLLRLTPNSGAAPGANPTITYTFQDGATTGSEIPYAFVQNQSTTIAAWDITVVTSTTVVMRFLGTPTPATLYGVALLLVWADD